MPGTNSGIPGVSRKYVFVFITLAAVVTLMVIVIVLLDQTNPTPLDFKESQWYKINDTTDNLDDATIKRRDFIKEMMEHAWNNYVEYAWGNNELKPLRKTTNYYSSFSSAPLGQTIIESMDTLYIMGMIDEFKKGWEWIAHNYDFDQPDLVVSVFETNISLVGGLLACFALTGDVMFIRKAELTAQKLLPAFETQTGIPYRLIDIRSGSKEKFDSFNANSVLAEFGSLSMEFGYLSDVTGNTTYREKVDTIRRVLKGMRKVDGLYPILLNPDTGNWATEETSIGMFGDGYFDYLLKEWLRTGRKDKEARQIYDDAMQAIITQMLDKTQDGLEYFSNIQISRKTFSLKMTQHACFSGGLLALGSHTLTNSLTNHYMEVAKAITHTCHEASKRTATNLLPEMFFFSDKEEITSTFYYLYPDVVESYFFLWRTTKDPKYREWGWKVAQAIRTHCWLPGGYSGIKNVYVVDSERRDVQDSHFLGETLKYLYLLFSDDNLIPLDQWVFNKKGHLLPVKGNNHYYRQMPYI